MCIQEGKRIFNQIKKRCIQTAEVTLKVKKKVPFNLMFLLTQKW